MAVACTYCGEPLPYRAVGLCADCKGGRTAAPVAPAPPAPPADPRQLDVFGGAVLTNVDLGRGT